MELLNLEIQHQEHKITEIESILSLIQSPSDVELANELLKQRLDGLRKGGVLPIVKQEVNQQLRIKKPRNILKTMHELQDNYWLDPDDRLQTMRLEMIGYLRDLALHVINNDVYKSYATSIANHHYDATLIKFFNDNYRDWLALQWSIQDGVVTSEDSYLDWIKHPGVRWTFARAFHFYTLKLPPITRRLGHLDPMERSRASVI